ncbi:MAG TPA: ring-cleaving dioxygenase [Chloroflexota bacterium]|nr:ring-cleaving dioxygenase [Chloroflexota bacterium]
MPPEILGIHHLTAIASDPQRNLDFYAGVLGLRLLKVTVNFDMPETYHLYYGDAVGSPGTILTFFPWIHARQGRRGIGQVTVTSFASAHESLSYWAERLTANGVDVAAADTRFDEQFISFADPDGLQVEIVARSDPMKTIHWTGSPVPAEFALRGFLGATILAGRPEATEGLLSGTLGFSRVRQEGNRVRYQVGPVGSGQFVDILRAAPDQIGHVAVGSVHHIAWRTPSDEQELAWRAFLARAGVGVTPVRDRQYFHSIYFAEPSGVLFEIATDPPGFAIDETNEELGSSLKLPAWLEPRRSELESVLPPLRRP